jgi:uncharacterized damage-inducible protein DinB
VSPLIELYRHHLWANLTLLDHVATLDEKLLEATTEGVFGRVDATLRHIIANEEGYLAHMGHPVTDTLLFHIHEFPGIPELRRRAEITGRKLIELAGQVTAGDTIAGTHEGQAYSMPAVVPLMQAINHGTEHRAHVITVLSRQGVPPIALDAWTFWENGMGR